MDFIDCPVCGSLAVKERIRRDQTATVFCTHKFCGRYDITRDAMQAFTDGAHLRFDTDQLMHRIYTANRRDARVLVTRDDLLVEART